MASMGCLLDFFKQSRECSDDIICKVFGFSFKALLNLYLQRFLTVGVSKVVGRPELKGVDERKRCNMLW